MNWLTLEILWLAIRHKVKWLERLIYRRYCPYPAGDYHLARDCVRRGDCGCDNQDRYSGTGKRTDG